MVSKCWSCLFHSMYFYFFLLDRVVITVTIVTLTPPEQMKEMVTLYKERLVAIDRSSIKCTVQAKRDLYNSLSPTTGPSKPRLDHALLHRQSE